MVAVVVWGCWKLTWRRIRQKQYKVADLEKSQMGMPVSESNLDSEEIPFGIRALEAGVEVEGVVISRPTSPRPIHNRNSTSNMTLVDGRSSMGSLLSSVSRNSLGPPSPGLITTFNHNVQQPMMQQLRPVYQPSPYSNYSGSTIHNLPSQQSSSAPTRSPSADIAPALTEQTIRVGPLIRGPSSPPLAYSNRVAAMINSQRRAVTNDSLRPGQPNVYGPSRSPSPPDTSPLPSLSENQVSDSRDSDSSGANSEDDKRGKGKNHSDNSSSSEESKDLSLLRTHRLSHAAEVGQLTRRAPGPARQSTTSVHSFRGSNTPPNGIIYNTSSPVYPVDITMPPSLVSPEAIEFQHSQRRALSTFQFNQNVELARELFQPQLAAQPRDEVVSDAGDATLTSSQPTSIRSKKSVKKLVKKNRQSQGVEGEA